MRFCNDVRGIYARGNIELNKVIIQLFAKIECNFNYISINIAWDYVVINDSIKYRELNHLASGF